MSRIPYDTEASVCVQDNRLFIWWVEAELRKPSFHVATRKSYRILQLEKRDIEEGYDHPRELAQAQHLATLPYGDARKFLTNGALPVGAEDHIVRVLTPYRQHAFQE